MLIIFFAINNIVYFEFIPKGQTVIQAYYSYLEILKWLREAVLERSPELCLAQRLDSPP
jgi:hypothetical protein